MIGYGSALMTVHNGAGGEKLGQLYYDNVRSDEWVKLKVEFTVPKNPNPISIALRDGNGERGNLIYWDFVGILEIDR